MPEVLDDIQPSRVNKSADWNWTTPVFQKNGIEFATVDDINLMLPAQASNAGKFLSTDGSNTFWETTSGGGANVIPVTGTATNYTTTVDDLYVGVSDTSVPRTITLMASPPQGKQYIIKDETGGASVHNITINGNGKNVDGNGTYVMDTDYAATALVYRNNWFIV